MCNYIKAIEDIKEDLNEEITSSTIKAARKNILVNVYYDLCFSQEKLVKGSSGLVINSED